jgi:hypothetical protein
MPLGNPAISPPITPRFLGARDARRIQSPAVAQIPAKQRLSVSGGMSAGMHRDRRSSAPNVATKDTVLQDVFNGSDGTRTRDLRRDRPTRVQRCPTTSEPEQPHLQVVFRVEAPPHRIVEPIVKSTFGPRVGTKCCLGKTIRLRLSGGGPLPESPTRSLPEAQANVSSAVDHHRHRASQRPGRDRASDLQPGLRTLRGRSLGSRRAETGTRLQG